MPEFESEAASKENGVKELQASLFPPSPRGGGSYLSNFLLKFTSNNDEDDESQLPRLKETINSRELIAISREQVFNFQSPRWPTECQVLEERVTHVNYTPSVPEPYYVPSGNEAQPKPVGEECGIIVYQYYPISAVNYFSRSSIGGSKYLLPTCPSPEEDSLRFESRFESGNLAKAIRITPNYYELYLRTDLYTNKHMQWFYFKVTNMRKNFLYRFSIVNLSKDDSLYNEGMKPLMYSTKDSQLHSIGWRHCGDNVTYFCNDNVTAEDPEQQMTYTLTFTVEFPHESDEIYFAHSYPYTYSDLQDYLMELVHHPIKSSFTTLRLLCKTLAGNNVYFVTITSPPSGNEEKKKKAVVLTARVHPGETPSSWMMKGMLDFLTGDSSAARELREKFIFKLVPMLNPDGVIVGNNRCSLTGRDLNRQYRTVIRETYPSIWYTKLMVRRLLEECGVAMYCDLHAHSRKHNIFIYGCENRKSADKRLYEQVFPLMLHKNSADKFSFEDCHFRIHRAKEGTGRVVMWMMGIANSYTMEASFGGSLLGNRNESHFSTQDYELHGKAFCQTLLDFYDDGPFKERLRMKILTRLLKEGSRADEPTNIKLSDYTSDEGDTSSSSSNEASREVCEVILTAPPPSPAVGRKQPSKSHTKKKPLQVINKSSSVPNRKTLPLCKTVLELPVVPKQTTIANNNIESYSSDLSDFESDEEVREIKPPHKVINKNKKKKKTKKRHKGGQKVNKEAEGDDVIGERFQVVSLLDITPASSIRAHSWHRTMVSTPYSLLLRTLSDSRKVTTQQLIEVQAKLNSLRGRLWFGVGEGDVDGPLSWGTRTMLVSDTTTNTTTTTTTKASKAKKKGAKLEKRGQKKAKNSEESKLAKKQQNGYKNVKLRLPTLLEDWERFRLKRQNTTEWGANQKTLTLKKTRSLPNTALHLPVITNVESGSDDDDDDDDKAKKKKKPTKKKKKAKTTKKAKT